MVRKITKKNINSNLDNLSAPISKEKLRPSAGREKMIGEFYFLDTSSLIPYPGQARKKFDESELKSLATTIEKHGIRQPLSVSKIPEQLGRYHVISGERRLRAAKLIGLDKIPCIILDDDANEDEIALVENLQRKDLHPIEIGLSLADILKKNKNLSQAELSKGVGLTKQYVSECLQYLTLPISIQNILLNKNIQTRLVLRRLLKCNNEHAMKTMLGEDKKTSGRPRKRSVFNIFIENGELSWKKGSARLTKEEKDSLVKTIEKMLDEIKSQ